LPLFLAVNVGRRPVQAADSRNPSHVASQGSALASPGANRPLAVAGFG
jgi:hypothetical protein